MSESQQDQNKNADCVKTLKNKLKNCKQKFC